MQGGYFSETLAALHSERRAKAGEGFAFVLKELKVLSYLKINNKAAGAERLILL